MGNFLRNRNYTLDLFKLFSAYLVVFAHTFFYGYAANVFDAFARITVPLFCFAAGYFSYNNTKEQLKKRTIKILKLTVYCFLLYFLYGVLKSFVDSGIVGIGNYINNILKPFNLIKLFVFNTPVSSVAVHLWFLPSLLYVYVIKYFASKFNVSKKVFFYIAITCLVLQFFLGEVLSFFSIQLPEYLLRNFFLMGIPFFEIGEILRQYSDKLKKIKLSYSLITLFIGVVLTLLSRSLLGKNEIYVGSLFIFFGMATISLKYSEKSYPRFFVNLIACTTNIYIFHPIVRDVILKVSIFLGVDTTSVAFYLLLPIMVCVSVTVLAFCINLLKAALTKHFNKTKNNSVV